MNNHDLIPVNQVSMMSNHHLFWLAKGKKTWENQRFEGPDFRVKEDYLICHPDLADLVHDGMRHAGNS